MANENTFSNIYSGLIGRFHRQLYSNDHTGTNYDRKFGTTCEPQEIYIKYLNLFDALSENPVFLHFC